MPTTLTATATALAAADSTSAAVAARPAPPSLAALENAGEFIARHIGPSLEDEAQMLAAMGAASRQALLDAIVPPSIARSSHTRPRAKGTSGAVGEALSIM